MASLSNRAIGGHKANFTRKVNSALKLCDFAISNPSSTAINRLQSSQEDLDKAHNKLVDIHLQLLEDIESGDDDSDKASDDVDTDEMINEISKRYEDCSFNLALRLLSSCILESLELRIPSMKDFTSETPVRESLMLVVKVLTFSL